MHLPTTGEDPVSLIERALAATLEAEPIEARIRAAVKEGRFDAKLPPGAGLEGLLERAQAANVVTLDEVPGGARRARPRREGDPRRRLPAGPRGLGDAARRARSAPSSTTPTTTSVAAQKAAA